jgi:hypothetical protein
MTGKSGQSLGVSRHVERQRLDIAPAAIRPVAVRSRQKFKLSTDENFRPRARATPHGGFQRVSHDWIGLTR